MARFRIKALRVRDLCDERGWTADDLARHSGVSFSTVRNLLYGQTKDPTISTLIPIARALGKHVEDLVVEDTEADQ